MVTDVIKKDYMTKVIKRDIRNIYKAQSLIATKNIYTTGRDLTLKVREGRTIQSHKRLGRFVQSLKNPDYSVSWDGDKLIVVNTISKQLRFLDMKKLGNWRIYNRQVWGILYNNSYMDIMNEVYDEVHDYFGDILNDVFDPEDAIMYRKKRYK